MLHAKEVCVQPRCLLATALPLGCHGRASAPGMLPMTTESLKRSGLAPSVIAGVPQQLSGPFLAISSARRVERARVEPT
eukprot:CAMPEP_0195067016 /NCGR_PEP_ID=MMETSP0448-20130528/12210_1 /TAXON_ID=66468 /ORGANISM="Heterocapsa triquestra, Strain CCMP 448" /LENGTH=78 /DNA_ID=CAMNT_0040098365 /DNA_START=53 /DNA_END=285 /DNA_ORIENTATION=+